MKNVQSKASEEFSAGMAAIEKATAVMSDALGKFGTTAVEAGRKLHEALGGQSGRFTAQGYLPDVNMILDIAAAGLESGTVESLQHAVEKHWSVRAAFAPETMKQGRWREVQVAGSDVRIVGHERTLEKLSFNVPSLGRHVKLETYWGGGALTLEEFSKGRTAKVLTALVGSEQMRAWFEAGGTLDAGELRFRKCFVMFAVARGDGVPEIPLWSHCARSFSTMMAQRQEPERTCQSAPPRSHRCVRRNVRALRFTRPSRTGPRRRPHVGRFQDRFSGTREAVRCGVRSGSAAPRAVQAVQRYGRRWIAVRWEARRQRVGR